MCSLFIVKNSFSYWSCEGAMMSNLDSEWIQESGKIS